MSSPDIEIYKLAFPGCDKVYIGSSFNSNVRYRQHVSDLVNSRHCNIKLQRYFNKHKVTPDIEVLDTCTEKDRFKIEQDWINKFNSMYSGFNIAIASSSLSKTELEELRLKAIKEKEEEQKNKLLTDKDFSHAYRLLINLLTETKSIYRKDLHNIEPNLLKSCKLKSASTSKLIISFKLTVPILIECVNDFIRKDETDKSFCLYVADANLGYSIFERKGKTQNIQSVGDVLVSSIVKQNKYNNMIALNTMIKGDYEQISR